MLSPRPLVPGSHSRCLQRYRFNTYVLCIYQVSIHTLNSNVLLQVTHALIASGHIPVGAAQIAVVHAAKNLPLVLSICRKTRPQKSVLSFVLLNQRLIRNSQLQNDDCRCFLHSASVSIHREDSNRDIHMLLGRKFVRPSHCLRTSVFSVGMLTFSLHAVIVPGNSFRMA